MCTYYNWLPVPGETTCARASGNFNWLPVPGRVATMYRRMYTNKTSTTKIFGMTQKTNNHNDNADNTPGK